jgi:chromosome segregation ATPase
MDAIIADASAADSTTSELTRSRPGATIWSLRKSRHRWKSKYQQLKVTLKASTNRVADLTRSRQLWRLKAERAEARVAALQAELDGLRAQLEARAQAEPSGGKTPAG